MGSPRSWASGDFQSETFKKENVVFVGGFAKDSTRSSIEAVLRDITKDCEQQVEAVWCPEKR
jgi:hypothetical protein